MNQKSQTQSREQYQTPTMKLSILISFTTLLSLAAGFSPCMEKCALDNRGTTDCTTIKCACHDQKLRDILFKCVESKCSPGDLTSAKQLASQCP
ncbi:uncharacterized protein BDW47DRAFT_104634 [Aspergillus candidus]|uniref:CFEM domain-containing protein n=1 Tax=Aspergillus candidus TaxID=41067 RepID=A0A2I2FDF6_ASPCN|nr:hypothetical protein BDW47DRAFT_104634 [Aspergillus candidus]PLB38652.1 hypothetical protein BDW47DRAFT_104634 [Aspergillus candidus]